MALLHGAEALLSDAPLSDLDVAVGDLPFEWDHKLVGALESQLLLPVIAWPYDSSAVTVFLATEAFGDGVQLDLLYSPGGKGKYGFRTDVALRDAQLGQFGPMLSAVDSWLYQLRKRCLKGQYDRVTLLLGKTPASADTLAARADELFISPHSEVVRSALVGHRPVEPRSPLLERAARAGFRLRHPAGLWVHVGGSDAAAQATELHARLRRFVVRAELVNPHAGGFSISAWSRACVTRWRAGAVVSWGAGGRSADVNVSSSAGIGESCEIIRVAASQRCARHLALLRSHTSG